MPLGIKRDIQSTAFRRQNIIILQLQTCQPLIIDTGKAQHLCKIVIIRIVAQGILHQINAW